MLLDLQISATWRYYLFERKQLLWDPKKVKKVQRASKLDAEQQLACARCGETQTTCQVS